MQLIWMAAVAVGILATPALAAQEFYVGEPVVKEHLQIVPNYLTGVEMNRPAPGMEMGADAIPHLEADRARRQGRAARAGRGHLDPLRHYEL